MFRYGKIALGCSLSSALYCFYNQIPMIYVERRKVHPFEFFEPDTDLSLLKIEPLRYDLKMSDEGVAVFGPSKRQVYEKIMVLLSLSGLVPFSKIQQVILPTSCLMHKWQTFTLLVITGTTDPHLFSQEKIQQTPIGISL